MLELWEVGKSFVGIAHALSKEMEGNIAKQGGRIIVNIELVGTTSRMVLLTVSRASKATCGKPHTLISCIFHAQEREDDLNPLGKPQ